MGLEFGHNLGLRRALRGLPLSPLVAGYGRLVAQQRALGLRHIGDALVEHGRVLRVLDGVFEEGGARRRQHIGADRLRQMGAARGGAYGPLLAQLEAVQLQDPAALRRILLYQLVELLQAHPQGSDPATAVALGVCPQEAGPLVRVAAAHLRLDGQQRRAVEELADAWADGKVRRAAGLAALLPAGGGGDALLRRRLAEIAERVKEADDALDAAREAERAGDTRAAEDCTLRAAHLASDCPRALLGLVRLHRPGGGGGAGAGASAGDGGPGPATGGDRPGPAAAAARDEGTEPGEVLTLRAAPESVAVTLSPSSPAADAASGRRVVRLTRVPGGPTGITEITDLSPAGGWVDHSPPFGQEVRYAALPLRDGRIDGPPVVSDVLLVAPDVSGLRSTTGRGRVEATWTEPSGALGVRVQLVGPEGPVEDAKARTGALTATGLGVGAYVLRVHCRYRSPDQAVIESAGAEHPVSVDPWPAAVDQLDATVVHGAVRFSWSGGEDADVRLVSWPAGPPEPGAELTDDPARPWPAPLPWEAVAGGGLVPPPGSVTRVSALAVLGPRAVAGPGLVVECPSAVAGARVERVGGGRARVTFAWPAEAGEVAATVEQDGASTVHRVVARSTYVREGLYVDVAPSAFSVTLSAAPRTPDAVVVPPPGGAVRVPADVAVSYRIVPGARRALRRRPSLLRVTLSCPGEVPADLPEFVLVARSGNGRDPVRPRTPTDGTTLLRVGGGSLRPGSPVELPVPSGLRPPYALRGFLLGEGAADVRLDEPSPTTLVVR
ncbi:tetratricopeptide repeat protein [Streptomyces cyaneofuscatus]|uniref:tetratricopeptide repeat protein n=1 Tax=Streptomyces cyaneofuscatus TaxID=66883 RepID=UPI0037A9638E